MKKESNMYVIGVTGGIGTGKSTVCNFLRELGAIVFDFDRIGHESYKRGTDGYRELVAAFGETILSEDREIDRKKLGEIVFRNLKERKRLHAIVWPRMREIVEAKLQELKNTDVKVAVLEAAVFIEAGWQDLTDELWVVVASREKITERLKKRNGWDDEEIARRMEAQYPREVLASRADVVVDADCSLSELADKISILWSKRVVSA